MFGLGVGGLVGGLLAERVKSRMTVFFVVQVAIGCFAVASILLLDRIGERTAGAGYVTSFAVMSLYLILPTFLMGITLPLLVKIVNGLAHDFIQTVSLLYFVNTIGAAVGALFGSYVLISLYGLDTAVYVGAAINICLGLIVFVMRHVPERLGRLERTPTELAADQSYLGRIAYLLVFVTGFVAIGYEIVWFRVIGVLVKASSYAFSSVLCIYLAGIAVGSFAMGRYLHKHRVRSRRQLYFKMQFFIGLTAMALFAGYYYLTRYTGFGLYTEVSFECSVHPPLQSSGSMLRDLFCSMDIFLWPMFFVLVPTGLMGASFPLVSSLALPRKDAEGRTVGLVFFFTIAGNVAGAVVTAFVLLGLLGTERTMLLFGSVGILFGLLVTRMRARDMGILERVMMVVVLLAAGVLFMPAKCQLYELIHASPGEQFTTYLAEGTDGVVVTYEYGENVANYINGLAHGMRPQPLFSYETVEAASYAPSAEDVLVIGFGTGAVTEVILKADGVRSVTVVEISRTLMQNLQKVTVIAEILSDERVDLVIEDGRRFLLRTDEKFDLILTDPMRATTSHSNNLYSRDFYEIAKQRLNPGGVVMVGIYETDEAINRVMRKTVASAFQYVRAYRFFCLASDEPFEQDSERKQQLISEFPPALQKMLSSDAMLDPAETGGGGQGQPRPVYLGDQDYIRDYAADYPINRDTKPVCEYYIGLMLRKGTVREARQQ
jgi:predicted membrane-bound spermidine synthase